MCSPTSVFIELDIADDGENVGTVAAAIDAVATLVATIISPV